MSAASFASFALKDEIMKAITDFGFEHPSEGKEPLYFVL